MIKRLPLLLNALVLAGALALAGAAEAQSPAAPAAAKPVNTGPAWSSLSKSQQEALAPLQRDWPSIDANRKTKWLEVAAKFPTLPAAERERIQARMADWSKLTPAERGRARLQFQESRQFAPEDRQARWEAYQALPEEARAELAQRRKPTPPNGSAASLAPKPTNGEGKQAQVKRNVVPPAPTTATATPRPVGPTVVQVKPGATTTLMSRQVTPPAHQQPGLPKIAATEGFVDRNTLLPTRGPQGAAVRSALAASAPVIAP